MFGRIAAAAALIVLAGCAGMEPAGRNASRSPQPTRVASAPPVSAPAPATVAAPPPQAAPTPPPRVAASTPAPQAAPATPPPVAAPPPAQRAQTTPPAQAPRPTAANDPNEENVVVPGVRERQVPAPGGDPRSNSERMEDIRAWDRCVMRVQGAADADPLRPQLETPEDYCRESLGMANRNAIPASRLERR